MVRKYPKYDCLKCIWGGVKLGFTPTLPAAEAGKMDSGKTWHETYSIAARGCFAQHRRYSHTINYPADKWIFLCLFN